MNLFKTKTGHLRNTWWAGIFFLVLAVITFPVILFSQQYKWEITITHQAMIVIATSAVCQQMRKKPFTEITGRFNFNWFGNLLKGCAAGAGLMVVPAAILYTGGWVTWNRLPLDIPSLLSATAMFISVALAEEFLFRGFVFQRLINGIGVWPAQLIIAGYFLLIHFNNPGMTGTVKIFASVNIFIASILFGLAFIKTKSLAMPLGIHFMANWTQGTLLGFGVSGNAETGFFKPLFNKAPEWLTGGNFGLEASLLGLLVLLVITAWLYVWKPAENKTATNTTYKNPSL